ncbi:MAG: hypothetical protein NTX59_11655 [Elusimicrobia bacterium]|nr:hypothetical protein [Elusimicrobiota bacterium]
MKNLTSAAGWLLLAAVLAVPSFLFYNWWSKNKEKAALERAQAVNSGNVFPVFEKTPPVTVAGAHSGIAASPAQGKQIKNEDNNATGSGKPQGGIPSAADSTSKAAQVSATAAGNSRGGGRPDDSSAGGPEGGMARPESSSTKNADSPLSISAQVALSSAVPAATQNGVSVPGGQAGVTTAVAVSTQATLISYFKPKYDRDPTISPKEYRQKKEEEERRAEEEKQRLAEARRRSRETGIEGKLRLQGIVGNSVIINGDMYNVGQTIFGARILKVGTDYFIGEYKGKQFKKVLK